MLRPHFTSSGKPLSARRYTFIPLDQSQHSGWADGNFCVDFLHFSPALQMVCPSLRFKESDSTFPFIWYQKKWTNNIYHIYTTRDCNINYSRQRRRKEWRAKTTSPIKDNTWKGRKVKQPTSLYSGLHLSLTFSLFSPHRSVFLIRTVRSCGASHH